jgi:hypothetical protein
MRVADAQIFCQKYAIRQHEELIYASSDGDNLDKVSHMDSAGDLDNRKAWRAVRRPSDMVIIPINAIFHANIARRMSTPSK